MDRQRDVRRRLDQDGQLANLSTDSWAQLKNLLSRGDQEKTGRASQEGSIPHEGVLRGPI